MYKPGAKMPAWLQDKSDDRSGKHESDNLHWVMFWLTRSDPRAPFADFQDASSLQEGAGADNWDGILDQSDPSVQHFVGDRHKKDASMTVKEMGTAWLSSRQFYVPSYTWWERCLQLRIHCRASFGSYLVSESSWRPRKR